MHYDTCRLFPSFSAGNGVRSEAAWGGPAHAISDAAPTSPTLATHEHFRRCQRAEREGTLQLCHLILTEFPFTLIREPLNRLCHERINPHSLVHLLVCFARPRCPGGETEAENWVPALHGLPSEGCACLANDVKWDMFKATLEAQGLAFPFTASNWGGAVLSAASSG